MLTTDEEDRRTKDAWLYNKFTYEHFGSGELKINDTLFLHSIYKEISFFLVTMHIKQNF